MSKVVSLAAKAQEMQAASVEELTRQLIDTVIAESKGPIKLPKDIKQVVDRLGLIKSVVSSMTKVEKAIKAHLIDKAPKRATSHTFSGRIFDATVSRFDMTDIDRDLLKDAMGEEWYKDHCKTIEVTKVTSSAKKRA